MADALPVTPSFPASTSSHTVASLPPPAPWRDPPAVLAALPRLVASADPAVTFTSLAAVCAPAFADACHVTVLEQGRPAHQIRSPQPGGAAGHEVCGAALLVTVTVTVTVRQAARAARTQHNGSTRPIRTTGPRCGGPPTAGQVAAAQLRCAVCAPAPTGRSTASALKPSPRWPGLRDAASRLRCSRGDAGQGQVQDGRRADAGELDDAGPLAVSGGTEPVQRTAPHRMRAASAPVPTRRHQSCHPTAQKAARSIAVDLVGSRPARSTRR
jgi:hypothetical protein